MLLVNRSGLVEEDSVEVFHYYDFHLSSSFFLCKVSSSFVENNNTFTEDETRGISHTSLVLLESSPIVE